MRNSSQNCFAEPYSHIYVENQLVGTSAVNRLLDRFTDAVVIPIDNYKQVFNRTRQRFQIQKKSPKLILAQKQAPFFLPFSQNCQTADFNNPVYITPALGCVYDCDFCFLHGMYNSANLVLFMNPEEIQQAVATELTSRTEPLWVSLSYETDLLALETIYPSIQQWIEFARQHPSIQLECRTRSAAFHHLASITPTPNFVLAWSLSPTSHARRYEHRAPSTEKRILAAEAALQCGWPVRLCFDPVLNTPDAKIEYAQLFAQTFSTLPAARLFDVTIGPFRMGADFFKRIKKARPACDLFYQPADFAAQSVEYDILQELKKYVPREKSAIWLSQS